MRQLAHEPLLSRAVEVARNARAGDLPDGPESVQGLRERVDHPQFRLRGVDQIVRSRLRPYAETHGRPHPEDLEPLSGEARHRGVVEPPPGTRPRLDRRALRDPARPRHRARVEAEVVLPRPAARSPGAERRELAEEVPQPLAVAGAALPVAVGLPEVPEHVEREPLPGERLVQDLRPREADPLPVTQARPLLPPLAVALELEEHRGQARGPKLPAGRQDPYVRHRGRELAVAPTLQPAQGSQRPVPRRAPPGELGGADLPRAAQPGQLAGHAAPGGTRGHGKRHRPGRREPWGTGQGGRRQLLPCPDFPAVEHEDRAVRRRGGGEGRGDNECAQHPLSPRWYVACPMRRLPCVLLALLAALSLAACGGGDSQSARKLVKEPFGNAQKVKGGKLDVKLDVDAKGVKGLDKPVTVTFGGPFERPDTGAPHYAFDLTASAQGHSFVAGAVSTGKEGFVAVQKTNYVLPPAQYKRLNDSYKSVSGITQPKANGNGDLPWLEQPQNEGDATVAGAETIHVSAGVDVRRLLDDLEQRQGGQSQKLTAGQKKQVVDAVKDPRFEFWTGKDDKVLRRVLVMFRLDVPEAERSRFQGLSSVDVKLDNTLSDLNEPQTITAPPSPRPVAELTTRVQSLLQQAQALTGAAGAGGAGGTPSTTTPSIPGSSGSGGATSGQADKYAQCLQSAGSDVAKLQKCQALLR